MFDKQYKLTLKEWVIEGDEDEDDYYILNVKLTNHGIAAAISPVGFLMDNIVDTLILIIMSSAVLVFAWTSKVINRKEGIAMLCMYAVYMVYICMR